MTQAIRVLAIEDDLDTQANLRDILELDGYEVEVASRISDALDRTDWSEYTAILMDRRLPDGMAEDLLPKIVELAPSAAVMVVTAYADFDGTVTALRHGVCDYILKPIEPDTLRASLQRIVRLRRAEERAQQAERLAAIGEMMAVLAHESRNAFQLAGAGLDLLTLHLEKNEEGLQLVERVRKHQQRINRLFEDVRGFAAPIQLDHQPTDLASVIQSTADQISLLNGSRQFRATITRAPNTSSLVANIDVFRMEQVFRNLMENSLAATTDPVEIEFVCTSIGTGKLAVIEIQYRDNGPGLTPECRQRVFEPFFTTKQKGTGLGMAITRRIVEAHGGVIEVVDPVEQSGARFIISIPSSGEASAGPID